MADSNTLSSNNDDTEKRRPAAISSQLSGSSVTSIPQIILTEADETASTPPQDNADSHAHNDTVKPNDTITTSNPSANNLNAVNQSRISSNGSLSPPASSLSPTNFLTSPKITEPISPLTSIPLPLTKDLLHRKNKLDRLLLHKARRQQQQQQQQHTTHGVNNSSDGSPSSPTHYAGVDERVTAGLGITMGNYPMGISSSGLRARIPSLSRLSSSIRSVDHEYTSNRAYSSSTSNNDKYQHSSGGEWSSTDMDMMRKSMASTDDRSTKSYYDQRKYSAEMSRTSMSGDGSSNLNNSMKVHNSAKHRYMDRDHSGRYHQHHHHHHHRQYQRYNVQQEDQHSIDNSGRNSKKYPFFVQLLFNAASRVVNTRGPESKEVKQEEARHFNLSPLPTTGISHMIESKTNNISHRQLDQAGHIPVSKNIDTLSSAALNEKLSDSTVSAAIPTTVHPSTAHSAANINTTITNTITTASSLPRHSNISRSNHSHPSSILQQQQEQEGRISDIEDDSILFRSSSVSDKSPRISRPLQTVHSKSSCTYPPNIPQPLFYVEKPLIPNPLQGRSFYLFSPTNPVRFYAWKFIRSRYVEAFTFLLIVLHWFILACVPIPDFKQKIDFGAHWSHYIILCIQSFYSLEMICKAMAYGLIISPVTPNKRPPPPPPPQQQQQQRHWSNFKGFLSFILPKRWRRASLKNTTMAMPKATTTTSDPTTMIVKTTASPENKSMDEMITSLDDEENVGGTISPSSTNSSSDFSEKKRRYKRNHRAFLYAFGNWFDTISIISYWADLILNVYKYPNLSLFKAMGAMRPIRLLMMLRGTAVILRSLETSWDLILAVAGLILFFLVVFALLGLISFRGVFSRRCYFTADDSTLQLVEPPLYCAGYYNDTSIAGPFNVRTSANEAPGTHGYICQQGQICMQNPVNNPNYGYVNFDNFFYSFLSVYTTMSLELWTDLMYQTQEAESIVSALYYCLVVYIVALVLSFLLFAVVTSAFARVRAESAVSAFTAKKKGYPLLRAAEGIGDDEAMWTFDNSPEELRLGVTRLRLRWWFVRLVKSRAFFYFGGFLVLFNLIFMCCRSFYASAETIDLVDAAETAFTFIFALEIILRMAGALSWLAFWSSRRNLFDLSLVIITCVIQLPIIQDSYAYKYLTIFQILRVYRLFICIPRVRRLLSAALGSGESVLYVMAFLILATAFCATVFMQMFGGDYQTIVPAEDPEPRFDTFWESFVSLIVVYTSEKWTDLLYDAMASQTGQGSIYAAIAISLYFAFGRYIMSGLYIAVVLENFELNDDYIRHYQIKDFIHRHRYKDKNRAETILLKLFRPLYYFNEKKKIQAPQLPTNLTVPLSKTDLTEILADASPKTNMEEEFAKPSWVEKKLISLYNQLRKKIPFMRKENNIKTNTPINPFNHDTDESPEDYDIVAAEENRAALEASKPIVNSLFIFSEHNQLRYYCKSLVGSSQNGQAEKRNLFNWFVMICVFVSILMVILDEPSTRLLRKDTSEQDVYDVIEMVLSIVFLIEVGIRIIADGLLLTPNAYLRNHWNQLDLCVILLNITTIFMSSEEVPRGLGTFRSLRILRLIRYFNGVRDIFVSLFYAFPLMFDALMFTALVLVPFALYGVNLFGGLMWACNDEAVAMRSECVGEYAVDIGGADDPTGITVLVPRTWQNPQNGFISFDDFPHALQHLFSLTSTEGWVDSMFSAMSTPMKTDVQPVFDWRARTIYHGIFYIIFMIISQGTIQLFVGVIIEKFKERNGITTLTTAQRQYGHLRRLLASVRPTIKVFRPKSKIRQICYDLVKEKHGKFNRLMMFLVCLNTVIIASEFEGEPYWLDRLQDYSYLCLTLIYVIECIIKLLGLGWKKWIRSKWNWFDFLLASTALLLLIIRFSVPDLWTVRVEQYCLVMVAFRLGEGIDALQTLYKTIAKSAPSIIQVSAVFMVAMCLFAMLFMEFFGLTKYGVYGNNHTNFRDYGNALLLLIRATTGEAWNAILLDYTVQYPNCNESGNYFESDCGSPFWAYFLFDMFYIVCTHIFLNLFTAVIISNFEYTYETRTRFTKITKADLHMFKEAWADIDPRGTGYIQKEDVVALLRKLEGPFRLQIYDDRHSVNSILKVAKSNTWNDKFGASVNDVRSPSSYYELADFSTAREFNIPEINKLLQKMDKDEVRRRRVEYNLYYKEILRSETTKGIPFASVLTILSYRFIDISASLKLDPLIARLEKIDQLTQEYHIEKAAGFFLTQVQKRRYARELWKKRDEDEVKKLGISSPSDFDFDPPQPKVSDAASAAAVVPTNDYPVITSGNHLSVPSPSDYSNSNKSSKKVPPRLNPSTMVPRIVIDNAHVDPSSTTAPDSSLGTLNTLSIPPVSPLSAISMDSQYNAYSPGGASLMVAPGTASTPTSPIMDTESSSRSALTTGTLSPVSPMPILSPTFRDNWLFVDGNVDMPSEISDNLINHIEQSIWSEMLREED